MTSTGKLTVGISTLIAVLTLGGCDADTAIATVDGPNRGKADGGTEVGQPDTMTPACPAGPMAPLGVACSLPGQVCEYGYNPPECGGRTVFCKNGSWAEQSHRDPQASCLDAGTHPDADGGPTDKGPSGNACVAAGGTCVIGGAPCARNDPALNNVCTTGQVPSICCLPSQDGGTDGRAADGAQCCPRSTAIAGCMHLGGTNTSPLSCLLTCDFFCSTNWRVETDQQGCEYWRYDRRQPAPGENAQCIVPPDAGNNGGG
ncbi:MAG TPA: hypothetical protein VFH73_26435 [Polyangia bacterium]|nr:hypothetical protein [Polyangia bacterium]